MRFQTTLPVRLVERRQHRRLGRGGADVDEPVGDRGRADDAGALGEVAAFAALAERPLPHHLAGVGVQRVDVAEVGAGEHAAVGHHRSRVDHASVRRRRLPGDAELGDVAGVDRLLLELLAVAVEGAAVERPLAPGGLGLRAAGTFASAFAGAAVAGAAAASATRRETRRARALTATTAPP